MTEDWTSDDWETPPLVAKHLAEIALKYRGTAINRIIEPFAGRGNIVIALQEVFSHLPIWANELKTERYEEGKINCPGAYWTNQDFRITNSAETEINTYDSCDQIVTNPPFKLAIESLKFFFNLPSPPDTVIMLLPIDFFCSKKRFKAIRETPCFIERIISIVGRVSYIKEGEVMKGRQIYDAIYIFHPGDFDKGNQSFVSI